MSERRSKDGERRRPATEYDSAAGALLPAGASHPVGRLGVKKTWKLYIGGAFVRSESGRYLVTSDGGDNYPRASRKDARDAIKAAVAALPGWAGKTAYNRGQILYRLAEVMEGRSAELEASLRHGGADDPAREVASAIDRVVSYAGWSDKYQSIFASSNPVAGPHFGFTIPEPMGVVGVAAPERPALLGLLGAVCPIVVSGNTAVVVGSELDPRTPLVLAECLATSDMPGGVVNLLTGFRNELLTHVAKHMGVRALDLWNVDGDDAGALEREAAENCKRVARRSFSADDWYDEARGISPGMIERFVESKTVWHPMGA
jgi:acyl-CoA reductase-like NAD-dependent aldehyde dehydrogenase